MELIVVLKQLRLDNIKINFKKAYEGYKQINTKWQ